MTEKLLRRHLKEHHYQAYQWARQCCRFQDELAKDVLQNVYLKVLESRAVWNQRSAFRTWLFSVIRYTAVDELRSSRHHLTLSEVGDDVPESSPEENTDYRSVIGKLPERQAEVLLLTFYHDMTLEEVASVTGLAIGTVRTHYDRGKKNLRKLLNNQLNDHATKS